MARTCDEVQNTGTRRSVRLPLRVPHLEFVEVGTTTMRQSSLASSSSSRPPRCRGATRWSRCGWPGCRTDDLRPTDAFHHVERVDQVEPTPRVVRCASNASSSSRARTNVRRGAAGALQDVDRLPGWTEVELADDPGEQRLATRTVALSRLDQEHFRRHRPWPRRGHGTTWLSTESITVSVTTHSASSATDRTGEYGKNSSPSAQPVMSPPNRCPATSRSSCRRRRRRCARDARSWCRRNGLRRTEHGRCR